jgi:hypothetical protein
LRGERDHCRMVAIPTIKGRRCRRPNRKRERLRAHMRLGKCRPVNVSFMRTYGTERIAVRKNRVAIGSGAIVRHERRPSMPRSGSLRRAAPSAGQTRGWS